MLIFKDQFGNAASNTIRLSTIGLDRIERSTTSSIVLSNSFGAWTFTNDGATQWFITEYFLNNLPILQPVAPLSPRVWTVVLDGNGSVSAGAGTPISYFIIGPNDSGGNGWSAVKSFFPAGASITFDWSWSTTDGINYDWPFAITSATEPFSYPSPPKLASANTQSGTTTLTVPAGQWASFGCYSSDSCCGDGRCTFSRLPAF
jgi:hypothetical protein